MNHKLNIFWCTWLTVVTVGVMLFSLTMLFFPAMIHQLFVFIAYAGGEPPAASSDLLNYLYLIYGITGAVMLGWMLVILFIIVKPFRHGEA